MMRFYVRIAHSTNSSTVSEHITRIHPFLAGRQILPFACSHPMIFQSKSPLNHHIANHVFTFHSCSHPCKYKAKNIPALRVHYMRKHVEQSLFYPDSTCASCSKSNPSFSGYSPMSPLTK